VRDRLLGLLIRAWVHEDGQTPSEYVGVLVVVAAVIAALVATGPGQAIGDKLSELVRDIAGDR